MSTVFILSSPVHNIKLSTLNGMYTNSPQFFFLCIMWTVGGMFCLLFEVMRTKEDFFLQLVK